MGFFSKLFKGIGKIFKAIFKFIGKIFSALFGKPKSPDKEDSKTNEELLSTTAQPARASPVLYGRGRVGGNRVYQNISSATDTKLITVLSFGVGQISEISSVRMDNNKICDVLASNVGQIQAINNKYNAELQTYVTTTPEGWKYISNPNAIANINARREAEINTLNASSGIVPCNKWVRIEGRLGSTTQPAMILATSNSRELTANSTGAGHVLLAVEQLKDQGTSDYQNAQADVKIDYVGRTIIDLRSMTLVAGCDNGPSVLWDYMTNDTYGCGYTTNEIDFSSFVKAANQVIVGFNGAVDNGKSQKSIIDAICNSFGGEMALVNGKATLVLDYSTTDYVYLNDEVLVGELSHESDVITNKFNGVDVNWTNPACDYTTQTLRYPPNFDQDPQIALERPNIKKFDLPYSTSKTDVDRMSSYYLNQRLIDETVTFQAIGFGTHVEVGNVVALSSVHKDWTNKLFRVVRVDKKLTQGAINQVQIQAKEFIPEVYSTVYTGAIIPDTESGIYNNSSMVSNVRIQMMPAEMGSCVRLRWDYVGNFVSGKFMVAYKPSTSSDWIVADDGVLGNMCDIYNLVPAASYDFRVCNVNKIGKQGPWVTVSGFRTADVISMPVVTNLRLVNRVSEAEPTYANSRDFVIAWDDVRNSSIIVDQYAGDASGAITASKLIRTYRVEVYEGARFKKSYDTTDPQFTYTFDRNAADGLSRNNTFKVRVVGHNNQIGNSVDITCKNPQCGGVSGMEDKCVAGTVFLKWAAPIEADYVGVLIYASKTPNVAISPENFKARSYITNSFSIDFSSFGGADAFIKYGAYDEFGEDEIVWKEQAVSTKGWVTESQIDKELKDKINAPITVERLPAIPKDKLDKTVTDALDKAAVGFDSLHVSTTPVVIDAENYTYNFTSTHSSMAEVTIEYACQSGGMVPIIQRIVSYADGNDMIYLQTVPEGKQTAAVGWVARGANKLEFYIKGCSPTNTFTIKSIAFKASSTESVYHPIRTTKLELVDKIETSEMAQIQELNLLRATFNDNVTATNTKFDSVTATLNGSIATSINGLRADFNDQNTAINNRINSVESTANANLAAKADELKARITTTDGNVTATNTALNTAKVDLTNAISASEHRSNASIANANGRIDSLITTVNLNKAKADESIAGVQTTLEANMTTTNGKITSLTNLVNLNKTSTDQAMASQKTQLEAEIESAKSSAKAEMELSVDAKLGSSYVVKTDVNGKFAGFGLMNKPNQGSTFKIQADKFMIDDGGTGDIPFAVEGGKTYIKSALIKDATIVNAHIADGAITNAKIANASIDNAKIGNVIMSSNYNWNNGNIQGWYLDKNYQNGGGLFVCGRGSFNNIDVTNSRITNMTGDNITVRSGTFTGTVNAQNGVFNGTVNANGGYFQNVVIAGNCRIDGTLSVNQINGVFSVMQPLNDSWSQDYWFGAVGRDRTVMVTGIDFWATGGETKVGSDSWRDNTYTTYVSVTINGSVSSRAVSATGTDQTNWRSAGHSYRLPAWTNCSIQIRVSSSGYLQSKGGIYGSGAMIIII